MRRMAAAIVGAVCAMSLVAAPAGAVSGLDLISAEWRCGDVIITFGPGETTRDNTGIGEEVFGYFITDANGVEVREWTGSFPVPQPLNAGDTQVHYFVEPTKNPLTISLVSIAGNGLPEQVVWTTSGDSPCLDPSSTVDPPDPGTEPGVEPIDEPAAQPATAAPRFTG